MKTLNLSLFIQIMQAGFMEHSGQEDAGCFLLDSINNQEYTLKHDCYINLDSKKISNIVKMKDPVPAGIKKASQNEDVIRETIKYFETEVVSDLNPHLKDDTLNNLAVVIRNDSKISSAKREFLLGLYKENAVGRFIAETFLYALNRENKICDSDNVEYDDIPLLDEVNYTCPLSHIPLIEQIKGIPQRKYSITQIFPEGLSEEQESAFNELHPRPLDMNALENLIALSEQSSGIYRLSPTVEEYDRLYQLKRTIEKNQKAKERINRIQLEEDIRKVVSALMDLKSETKFIELNYNALHIDEKVSNPILKNSIQFNALQYYNFVNSMLRESEVDFDLIATQIKLVSQNLEKTGNSQDWVISKLAEWIKNNCGLPEASLTACNIVVSFFVQNCEVFSK